MKRLASVLLWSVIAAAFIGPGTVTTAASAGAGYGFALLWALLFSTVATFVLQEASARVTIVSGQTLAEAIRARFGAGPGGLLVLLLVLGAIVLGNAAYEAGNILGGVAGAVLGTGISRPILTVAIGGLAGLLLWVGSPRTVAHLLSVTVAFMGIAFLASAVILGPSPPAVAEGLLVPRLPEGSGLLVLGLVGTTVVPYNLFLGSGIAGGQTLRELRFGLGIAVGLGGLISMAVLVVGSATEGAFSFEALAAALSARLGAGAGPLFAWGLFAAGLSSAVTAPLAAAVTAQNLFDGGSGRWHPRSWRYRAVWLGVLLVGVGFGLAEVRPVPAIILAQALNGILLPLAAIFLLLVVNDRSLMGEQGINGTPANAVTTLVVAVAVVLGVGGVLRASSAAVGMAPPSEALLLLVGAAVVLLLALPVLLTLRRWRGDF